MNYSLPKEHCLTLVINDIAAQKLICTDEALSALVYGFLYNEGYIHKAADVQELAFSADHSQAKIKLESYTPGAAVPVRFSGFAGVGVIREEQIENVPALRFFGSGYVSSCAKEAESIAEKYSLTGGMHCSALFDDKGMLMYYEDVGRHNTFDKICGRCLLERKSAADCLLVTTGRISEDMVKKAARMGISMIASYTTATDRAYYLAEKCGMTLIGYARKENFRLYSHGERLG